MTQPGLRSIDHHEDAGHARQAPVPPSALTSGIGARLLVAALASAVLWLFVAWALA